LFLFIKDIKEVGSRLAGEDYMLRLLFGIFLILHGLIHSAIWLPSSTPKGPFNAGHSWLLNSIGLQPDIIRTITVVVTIIAALALIIGGIGLLTHQTWFNIPILIGSIVSLLLIIGYFNPWMSLAILLDLGIIYLIGIRHWPV
jgi:uncharacterized membrane protein YphA (DoxX/SURF4 family)